MRVFRGMLFTLVAAVALASARAADTVHTGHVARRAHRAFEKHRTTLASVASAASKAARAMTATAGDASEARVDPVSDRRMLAGSSPVCDNFNAAMDCFTTSSESSCKANSNCAWAESECGTSQALDNGFRQALVSPAVLTAMLTCQFQRSCDTASTCESAHDSCIPTKNALVTAFGDKASGELMYGTGMCNANKNQSTCTAKSSCAWSDGECDFDGVGSILVQCMQQASTAPSNAPSTAASTAAHCSALEAQYVCLKKDTSGTCNADANCTWYTGSPPGTADASLHNCDVSDDSEADTTVSAHAMAHIVSALVYTEEKTAHCASKSDVKTCNSEKHCQYRPESRTCGGDFVHLYDGDQHDPFWRSRAKAEIAANCKAFAHSESECNAQTTCEFDLGRCSLKFDQEAAAVHCFCPAVFNYFPRSITNLDSAEHCEATPSSGAGRTAAATFSATAAIMGAAALFA